MTEKITEAQATDVLALLRTDASIDSKVAQVNNVKSAIKQNNVPEPCVLPLFEITRLSMASQQAVLVNAGFTTLNHLLTRLSRQEPKYITKEAGRTLPLVIEKIGDTKEKYRILAGQCLTTLWKVAPMDVERSVKNTAMGGKNSRAKEASMQWLVQMHKENGLQFRAFVPALMELLEDADGMVRDCAKNTVVELFQNAPNAAKSDLKKQLKIFNVRPAIVTAIISQLGPAGPVDAEVPVQEFGSVPPRSNSFENGSTATGRPGTPVTEPKIEHVEPAYVNTQRELDETFREMQPFFEGKESEQNWLKREQSCTKIRRLNAGNAPTDFRDAWLANLKSVLDGILKAINSLRTSLMKEGCSVIQEVARTAGPGLDSMVELLLQNLIKLCAGTKKLSSQAGDTTVDVIISRVSYNQRILQHLWLAVQDKNVQPRTYAAGWLRTLLKKEAHHKNHVEHTGGLDLIEKCLKKGLTDANPGVRERMRGTYWTFAQIWSAKAAAIMSSLEPSQQRLLEMDPANPNSPKKADPSISRPGLGFSKSTTGPPKPSLRETMLAQKKATLAAKNMPARPGSAMSTFSPMRTASNASVASVSSHAAEAPAARPARPEPSSSASHGGLSVAPMRPTKFRPRPELARPATAGPYSVRRPPHAAPSAVEPSTTTPSAKPKSGVSNATNSPPKRSIPRPSTSHSSHASQSSVPSPTTQRPGSSRIPQSPHSPHFKSPSATHQHSSPTRDEDFTMVMPNVSIPGHTRALSHPQQSTGIPITEDDTLKEPVKSLKVFEDPFSSNDDQTTPRPLFTAQVLEEVPINEDSLNLPRNDSSAGDGPKTVVMSPERIRQNSRLLESGITRVKAKSLDVHGFRKLQGLLRESKTPFTGEQFDQLLIGLFEYLESPLSTLQPEKVQDVKAQILATIKILLKRDRDGSKIHVSRGLRSLLVTRSCYDARAHIVSGLELLADDLVSLADPQETVDTITTALQGEEMTTEGCRTLSMGLHVLKELLDTTLSFVPSAEESAEIGRLAARCLESTESGVRMDAVQLCVSMHTRLGEKGFWNIMTGVKDDPKSLITYYIVKKQRELVTA